jgi:23S rRNA pseudouridine1911/1915/1917 synthase
MNTSKIGDWVIYKNNQLIAFNKPPALPVQADKTEDKSLQQLGEIFCHHPLHLIHRIDRPASGIVLFAKSKSAMTALTEQFKNRAVRKTYLAVVKDAPPQEERRLVHYLKRTLKTNKVLAFETEVKGAEMAEMTYKIVGKSDQYHFLEIELITGRHHQIRAQLAAIGCPIKGDVKYGFRRSNADRSIHLHAWKLEFRHPVSGEKVELTADLPKGDPIWEAYLKN